MDLVKNKNLENPAIQNTGIAESIQVDDSSHLWIDFSLAHPATDGYYWIKNNKTATPEQAFYDAGQKQFIGENKQIKSQVQCWTEITTQKQKSKQHCSEDCISALSKEVHCQIKVKGQLKYTHFRKDIQKKANEIGIRGWVQYTGSNTILVQAYGKRFQLYSLRDFIEQGNDKTSIYDCQYTEIEKTEKETGFSIRKRKKISKTNRVNWLQNIKKIFTRKFK